VLSQTAEYAVRAVLYLAERANGASANVEEIADELSIPQNYLSKTLQQLARAGVLVSSRGKKGGFALATAPDRITLLEVVQPFDQIDGRRQCLLGRPTCSDIRPCEAHARWKKVSEPLAEFFRETTFGDLLRSPAGRGSA
jgi:Rrf2 family protein